MKQHITVSDKRGFAMLFAVLVSSVLLSVGISIFNLTVKELVLSSSGRESQFAFYAADTGIECALYWDFKSTVPSTMYATSSASQTGNWRTPYIDSDNPSCVGVNIKADFITPISTTGTTGTTRFQISIPNTDAQGASAPYCAIVTVIKNTVGSPETTIESRGYNMDCNSSDQNRIERALRVTY